MKKFFAAVCMIALCLVSCNKTNVQTEDLGEYVQVSLGFSMEAPIITTTPMTKAGEARNWYQIQVYSAVEGKTNYGYYGYVFFDNVDNMLINLKRGYQYKFEVDMIAEGSEKINSFSLVNGGWANVSNSFYISSDEHVRYMGEGYLYMYNPSGQYNRPDVDRFFGVTEGYLPKNGDKVTVDMKRVSFGVKFVAKEFNDGKLEIQVDQAPTKIMNSTDGNELETVISFDRTYSAFLDDEYSENIAVNVILIKEDGLKVPLVAQDVTFVRNCKTTIEFNGREPSQNKGFIINAEEEWKTGETIFLEDTQY